MADGNLTNANNSLSRLLQLEVRAQKILGQIEARAALIREGARHASQAYFEETKGDQGQFWSPEVEPLNTSDLNRTARHWQDLIPEDLEARAVLIRSLSARYPFRQDRSKKLQAALGIGDEAVREAFLALYEQPLETIFEPGTAALPDEAGSLEEARSAVVTEIAQDWSLMDEEELDWVTLYSGSVLYEQGDPGDALYILVSGRLRSAVTDGSEERTVGEVARGEMVGAVEVLTGEKRSTRVYAVRDSELIRISQENLHRQIEKHPQIMTRMAGYLASNLKSQIVPEKKSANNLVSFALLRAGSSAETGPAFQSGALKGFPTLFAEALSAYGPVLLLNSEIIDRQTGEGWSQTAAEEGGSAWLAAYLSEQEARFRYVVYETDASLTPWTQRCLRQADRALIVAGSDEDPRPGEVERFLDHMEMPAEAELVLVHTHPSRRPSGTHRWLERRTVKGHHHVRADHADDLQRLVRRLTGRALGLVLSGGGARGYAHIGVLRALRESGLQVDAIAGTSMGSIVAALYAMDVDDAEMVKLAKSVASPLKLFDFTLPVVSFFKSEKMTNTLQDIFGSVRIEDLWRPYFCVSSSLTRAVTRVHSQGPLWEAVRASSAIPGVFSPVLSDGELLVDGAVLNNLPVDVMQNFAGCGPLVGVNVFPEVDLEREYDFGHSVSGWEVLLHRLNPFTKNPSAPLIFENILRVIALNDVHQAATKSSLCDLYITPRVERYGILEFKSYRQIVEIGYRTGMEAIEAWSHGETQTPEGSPSESGAEVDTPLAVLNRSLDELDALLQTI